MILLSIKSRLCKEKADLVEEPERTTLDPPSESDQLTAEISFFLFYFFFLVSWSQRFWFWTSAFGAEEGRNCKEVHFIRFGLIITRHLAGTQSDLKVVAFGHKVLRQEGNSGRKKISLKFLLLFSISSLNTFNKMKMENFYTEND